MREGDRATFTVDAYPRVPRHGHSASPVAATVQNVVTYDAVVGVDNGDPALTPGMTASTQIISDQRSDVLRVPDQALRYERAGGDPHRRPAGRPSRIWVLRDGRPRAR